MKKTKLITKETPLYEVFERFCAEERPGNCMSPVQFSRCYLGVVGRQALNVPPGFIIFWFQMHGTYPKLSDLNSTHIGKYWEYVAQNYGLLTAADAMDALKHLWMWCASQGLMGSQKIPADLESNIIRHPRYLVSTRITEVLK